MQFFRFVKSSSYFIFYLRNILAFHKYSGNRSKGFTLIELLLILIIFSITIALVFPKVTSGIGSVRLKTTSKKVATSLKLARNLAISERRTYYARILEGKLVIAAVKVNGEKKEVKMPEQLEVSAPRETIILFYPRGNSNGGVLKVRDKNSNNFYLVKVNPSTGKIRAEFM